MSAYIVEDSVIDALVTYARKHVNRLKYILDKDLSGDELGQILVNENYRSVNHRYRERSEAERYSFREYTGPLHAIQVIKACNCLDYQSCENNDYRQTQAATIINEIRKTACTKLPGYNEGVWGVPTNPARGGTGPVSLSALIGRR